MTQRRLTLSLSHQFPKRGGNGVPFGWRGEQSLRFTQQLLIYGNGQACHSDGSVPRLKAPAQGIGDGHHLLVLRLGLAAIAANPRDSSRTLDSSSWSEQDGGRVGRTKNVGRSEIDTTYLKRCIKTLEQALAALRAQVPDDILYDIYRAACVKEFELVLEQSGKLLKKRLRPWFASNRQADRLAFKDVFRHAAKHGLIPADACERWLEYRDNRNDTAHDYGKGFAESTLKLLPRFVDDARELAAVVEGKADG